MAAPTSPTWSTGKTIGIIAAGAVAVLGVGYVVYAMTSDQTGTQAPPPPYSTMVSSNPYRPAQQRVPRQQPTDDYEEIEDEYAYANKMMYKSEDARPSDRDRSFIQYA